MTPSDSATPGEEEEGERWPTWATIAALFLVVGALLALALTLPRPSPVVLSGQVRCASGAPVVGVWGEGEHGRGGWAEWEPHSTDPSRASFEYQLATEGPYRLHIGCGGTARDWHTTTRTSYIPLSSRGTDLVCYDSDAARRCVPVQETIERGP